MQKEMHSREQSAYRHRRQLQRAIHADSAREGKCVCVCMCAQLSCRAVCFYAAETVVGIRSKLNISMCMCMHV